MLSRPLILCFMATLTQGASAADAIAEKARLFLRQNCFSCHGADLQEAQLRYDQIQEFRREDQPLWTMIYEQISQGRMPPSDAPQPSPQDRQEFLSWLESQQRALKTSGIRRLNRRELSAALCDLTVLNVDHSQSLPGDGRVDGFDTGADALQDAAESVAQIMKVTRRTVESLRFLDPPSDIVYEANLVVAKDGRQAFVPWKKQGLSVSTNDTIGQPGVGLLLRPKWLGERGGLTFRVPPPERLGVLRLELEISAKKFREHLPNSMLWVEVGGRDLAYLEITNPTDKPRKLVFDVQLSDVAIDSKGLEIILSNRVEVPYEVPGFENEDKGKLGDSVPGGPGIFRPLFDKKATPLEEQPVPFLVLHSVNIEPYYRMAWPPMDWATDIGEIRDDLTSARTLLHVWIERAWRRPIEPREEKRFLKLYEDLRKQDLSFDEALQATFQSVLLAGSFRYLPGPGDVAESQRQYAIASRLSFMLWGTPPDAELRRLAKDGKLTESKTLDAQVDRMLADPRVEGFVRPFVTQWLEMDQPITLAMDHIQQQDFRFGRNLKASMKDETILYFREILRENRPAVELLQSDWTMMNDILAIHYGYEGITGNELRKTTLRKDDPRGGGLLGHAGIQSMLCWMGENWVIYRGAWTLRNILDDPPPPPPLEVPELIPSEGENRGKSYKELLQQHQADTRCAVCHQDIDPLGFAFQNFDLSGRWREVEFDHYVRNELDGKIEWRGEGKTRPVDAVGQLPGGETFSRFAECKQLLVEHYADDFIEGVLKNWVLFATGRRADIADLKEIRWIIAEHRSERFPLRDLLKALIRSETFLKR